MRTEIIKADTIDAAVDRILIELKYTRSSRENAIYFHGWDGLGASAVLRAIAQRLSSDDPGPGLEFEQVINIDCSKWEGTRAVQRAIAEHLKLPGWVMEMFDEQDEEDDFNGVDQGSRAAIADVAVEIERSIQSSRFLLVLHNGSNEEIDIVNLGLSLYGYRSNKMLWAFQGRSRLDPKLRDTTDVVLRATRLKRDPQELCFYLLRQEAAQVARKRGIDPAIFAECFSYMLERSYMGQHTVDYDWALHGCNYWICDGIIKQAQGIHGLLQEGGALHRDMELYVCLSNKLSRQSWMEEDDRDIHLSHMIRSAEHRPYWISTETCGFLPSPAGIIPINMFQHSDKLGVLKLSRCTFSFSSPPFLSCHSLRFLWLDRCRDLVTSTEAKEVEDTTKSWTCFQRLLVLDLCYTDWDGILSAQMMDLMELNLTGAKNWDMSRLRGRLGNIRKLRIIKSICRNYDSSLFSEMEQLELLDFSGNDTTQGGTASLPLCMAATSGDGLKTAIIHGSSGLINISFRGCARLKNLFLSGLFRGLEELDLSGTTLQTIDLSAMELLDLKGLLLLSCEGLRAILWPPQKRWLEVLRIDTTTTSASVDKREENLAAIASVRSSSLLVQDRAEAPRTHPHGSRSLREQKEANFNKWQISLTDARLFRSLLPVSDYLLYASVHIDICPAATLGGRNVVQGTRSSNNKQVQFQPRTITMVDSMYRDVFEKVAPANSYDDCDDGPTPSAVTMMWDCPVIQLITSDQTCIIEMIVHGQGNRLLDTRGLNFIYYVATSLHVYDNSSITCIPSPVTPVGSSWISLRWCRVERCPMVHTVFTLQHSDDPIFYGLRTFWGSQLPMARYIWNWPSIEMFHPDRYSFQDLQFLHLDYCPKLIHVLPLFIHMTPLRKLETIEIVCCGDLTEVFPLHLATDRQEKTVVFPKLSRIHLHELPKLQRICGHNVSMPELETVKIRGCWSLRRLPALGGNTKRPKVECEKEWWDGLEWDGMEAKHDRSLYEPSHSSYYKNAQLPLLR